MIAREGHRGGRRKEDRQMFNKTTGFSFFFTSKFPLTCADERRKNRLTAIVCFSLCRESPVLSSENGLFSSLPKPDSCIKKEEKEENCVDPDLSKDNEGI